MRHTFITLALAAAACLPALAQTVSTQTAQAVEWNADGQGGLLGGTTVTLRTYQNALPFTPPALVPGGWVASHFEAPWFSGPLSSDAALLVNLLPNTYQQYSINFSHVVNDVRVSLSSFASLAFVSNRDDVYAVRESGQGSFTMGCSYSPSTPCVLGAASDGATPNDANGTVLIPGPSSAIVVMFSATLNSPDSIGMQVSGTPLGIPVTAAPVPEPAAWALLLAGALPLLRRTRSRRA